MIRLLRPADRPDAYALLLRAPALNLYLLGNMETLGFDEEYCQFWGDFDDGGRLRGVVNRYMSGWAVYGAATSAWAELAAVIDGHEVAATRLQDNPGGIPSLLPWLTKYRAAKVRVEELMELEATAFQPQSAPPGIRIRRAAMADFAALVALYRDAGHMSRTPEAVERPLRDTRIFLAEEDERIVSVALTNAETAELAMIGGVFTPPVGRGRGLSQAVCSALCADLLADGKRPVLYWDTPAAGTVYRKLGFSKVGDWRSVWLESAFNPS